MNRIHSISILLLLGTLASPALARDNDASACQRDARDDRDVRYDNRNVRYDDRDDRDDRYDDRYGRQADPRQLQALADRLETSTDAFKTRLDRALDHSRLDGTPQEDRLNASAQALEDAADRLDETNGNSRDARRLANEVLDRAAEFDRLAAGARLDNQIRQDWRRVNSEVMTLASYFPRADDRDDWNRGRQRSRDGWGDRRGNDDRY